MQEALITPDETPGSIRPGGRTERNREAVAKAVLALLREGDTELRAADVAERAGVGRSTIYRRWPTRADLLREAQSEHTRELRVPDTGDFADDIRRLARILARFFSQPTEIAMSVAMAAHAESEFTQWQIDYWNEHAIDLARPFFAAIERGELAPSADPQVLTEMLIGPMVMRTVVMKQGLPRAFVERLAEHVIRAARAGAP